MLCNQYLDLLLSWSRIHNLTAYDDRQQMDTELVQQSLLLAPQLHGRVADIGTGAGIPGIPLAIARPELEFTLIDSRSKKTAFIHHVIQSLGLPNVTVVSQRIEDCRLQPFDTIVCRALGTIARIGSLTRNIRHNQTRLLCIRGHFDKSELADQELRLLESIPLSSDRQHNLVIMAQ